MRHSLASSLLLLSTVLPLAASVQDEPVAVSAVVFNHYARERQADGKFKPERYIFGEGGCWSRAAADPALDRLQFPQIARAIAAPLARMNYLPAASSEQAGLLILVFWGSTQGSRGQDAGRSTEQAAAALSDLNRANLAAGTASSLVGTHPAEESAADAAISQLNLVNAERDQLDARNARILGYTDALERAQSARHMGLGQDTLAELGGNRYFVVLQAYDNATAVQEKKLKPLWTTRLSVSESGDFAEALARLLRNTAHFFGQDSGGLHHQDAREGTVELRPLQILETVPANPK